MRLVKHRIKSLLPRNRLSKVFLLIVAFLYLGQCTVLALSADQLNALNIGALYYNTSACSATPSSSSSTTTSSTTAPTDVYILGDSITHRSQVQYTAAFTAKNITTDIDASDSRGLNKPGQTGNMLSGMQAIAADKAEITKAQAIVVALGTNGGDTPQSVDAAIAALRADNPTASIYWVDTISVGRSDGYNQSVIGPNNQAIYSEATSQKYTVISWFHIVDPNGNPKSPNGAEVDPNNYIDDSDGLGVHPDPAGITALVGLVTAAVTTGATNTPTTNTSSSSSGSETCCSTGASSSTSTTSATKTMTISYPSPNVSVTFYLPTDGQPHPLVVFAPGLNQDSEPDGIYASYLTSLASQGFVVAGVNFVDKSSDTYGDAQIIDSLTPLLKTEPKLNGLVTPGAGMGLIGHSNGGVIAIRDGYAAGTQDADFSAVMSLAGAVPGGVTLNPGKPLLVFHGTADTVNPITSSDYIYSAVNAPYKAFAMFKGADHAGYFTGSSTQGAPNFSQWQLGANAMTAAFFNRFLKGENDSSSDLNTVATKYAAQITFEDMGSDTPTTSSSSTTPSSSTTSSTTGDATCCGGTGTSSSVPAGTLPSFIPEPYNGAFTQGGKNHNVAPALIASLFSIENGLGNGDGGSEYAPNTASLPAAWAAFIVRHPDPNSGWPISPDNAQGPMQFEPSTFAGLGYNIADIDTLVTAADAAAKYVASNGATADKPPSSWQNAIWAYNHLQAYVDTVLVYYNYYNSQPQSSGSSSTATATTSATSSSGCSGSGTSPDCSASVTGDANILCDAQQYKGIFYESGGGHEVYSTFAAGCPDPSNPPNNQPYGGSGGGNPSPCATDCSGLISVAMNQAFKTNYIWYVSEGGIMIDESGSGGSPFWHQIPISQVQAGDIVTRPDHVELVDHIVGDTIYNFGSHYTGPGGETGPDINSTSYWTYAWHWTGPGSS